MKLLISTHGGDKPNIVVILVFFVNGIRVYLKTAIKDKCANAESDTVKRFVENEDYLRIMTN